jgi:type II secretory pathway component PulM
LAEAGSLHHMHPRYRRMLIPGVLVLLLAIVVVASLT